LLIGIIFDDTVCVVNILSYSIFAYNESHYSNEVIMVKEVHSAIYWHRKKYASI
jgi:hypothetical protein